ncbi:hypothetical protein [Mucilaginibacter celer]|uniref:hypothetical protein n=1 Tax=Mucilaginibacter celer TaxID=2305508 RepID=UPI0013CEF33E|nr:hypothetical protein [Mucilaginibacter celer]
MVYNLSFAISIILFYDLLNQTGMASGQTNNCHIIKKLFAHSIYSKPGHSILAT